MEDTNKIVTELKKLAVEEARIDREIRAVVESSNSSVGYRRRDVSARRSR